MLIIDKAAAELRLSKSSVFFTILLLLAPAFLHAADDAQFSTQTVVQLMSPKSTCSVSVSMRNSGNTTWTDASGYRLASQNPADNMIWGSSHVALGSGVSVAPGQIFTWTFNAIAPPSSGTYNFQWRLIREGVASFGELSPNLSVVVSTIDPGFSVSYERRMQEEVSWIMGSLSRPTGSFVISPGGQIVPYFIHQGLIEVLHVDPSRAARVKQYLSWYLSKLNRPDSLGVQGTVYNYNVVGGAEVSAGSYDSSDSYAATYLSLVRAYYDASGDLAFVSSNLADLKTVAGAIDATLQANKLTWARADYAIQFLMDNVEVWKGYSDFAYLLGLVGDGSASAYQTKSSQVRASIESLLWNPASGDYFPYVGGAMSWSTFYPNAAANLWPEIFGLPEADARKYSLWQKFTAVHGSTWAANNSDAFPWTALASAGAAARDFQTVDSFHWNTRAKFLPKRTWTWHIGEAGFFIRALSELQLSSAAVSASSATTMTYYSPSGVASITLPVGAFSGGLTLRWPAAFSAVVGGDMIPTGVGLEILTDNGAQPSRDALLSVPYRKIDVSGRNEGRFILARYDDVKRVWVPLLSTPDPSSSHVTAWTNHFSVFQIMEMVPGQSLDSVRVFPNPLRPALGHKVMTFVDLPSQARIRIYTLTGELVKDLRADTVGMVRWDGTNSAGAKAASGVYFVYAEATGARRTFKVAIQR